MSETYTREDGKVVTITRYPDGTIEARVTERVTMSETFTYTQTDGTIVTVTITLRHPNGRRVADR